MHVTKGKHKGKSGTVDRLTPLKVWIELVKGEYKTLSQVLVLKDFVAPAICNDEPSTYGVDDEIAPTTENISPDRAFSSIVPPPTTSWSEVSIMPLATHSSNHATDITSSATTRVQICGGSYAGETGITMRETAKMIYVMLDSTAKEVRRVRKEHVKAIGPNTTKPYSEPSNHGVDQGETVTSKPLHGGQTRHGTAYQLAPSCRVHQILGFPIETINLVLPNKKAKWERTFAGHLFGDRLLAFNIPFSGRFKGEEDFRVPPSFTFNGRLYEHLYAKLHKDKSPNMPFAQTISRIEVQYVAVSGEGLDNPIDLQRELDEIAHFSALSSTNVTASRLGLFATPAAKSNLKTRDYLIFHLSSDDFEEIDDNCNEGCGFVPRGYIEQFLGTHAVGKRTMALQFRLFAPRLGVFKGMFVEKPGITKIQLSKSMQKVARSQISDENWAFLLIKGCFPSKTSVQVAKYVLPPDVSAGGKYFNELTSMVTRLWNVLGVPESVIEKYIENTKDIKKRKHSFVVGLADPTGAIPQGHIFVPGLTDRSTLFVTRCPCMQPNDGHMLPVVTEKPRDMQPSDWEWLQTLPFGSIIFGNSRRGHASLPSRIANGDLDGDLYCLCWDDQILESITCTSLRIPPLEPKNSRPWVEKPNWFKQTQELQCNLSRIIHLNQLIGMCYKTHQMIAKESTIGDPDAIYFGEAYKASLDLPKHGGKVYLPAHLWVHVPAPFHKYLSCD